MASFKIINVFKASLLILLPCPHNPLVYRSINGTGIGLYDPIPVSLAVEQSTPDGTG